MTKKLIVLFAILTSLLIGCQDNDKSSEIDFEGVGDQWRAELNYEEEQRNNGEFEYEFMLVISYNGTLGESLLADQMSYQLVLGDISVFENTEDYDEAQEVSALYISGEGISDTSLLDNPEITLEVNWDEQSESFPLSEVEIDTDL